MRSLMFLPVAIMMVCLQPALAQAKQPLEIWFVQDWMQPTRNEQAFLTTYNTDAGFRAALDQAFDFRVHSIRGNPAVSICRGITIGPTFIVNGRPYIGGFRGADALLSELGLQRPRSAAPAPIETQPPAAIEVSLQQLRDEFAKALLEEIEIREQKLRTEHDAKDAATLKYLQGLEERLNRKSDDLFQQLQDVAKDYQTLPRLERPAPQPAEVLIDPQLQELTQPEPASTVSIWDRTLQLGGIALTIGQIVGVGSVSAGSFGLAGLGLFALKRWRSRAKSPLVIRPSLVPVAATPKPQSKPASCPECPQLKAENAALAQQLQSAVNEIEELRKQVQMPILAPFEDTRFREAYECSVQALLRNEPGASGNMTYLGSLIQQYLSAPPRKKVSS